MKRIPKWVYGLGGFVIVGIILLILFGSRLPLPGNAATASDLGYQTALVERGSLVGTVSATGTVRANQSTNLNWQVSAQVGELKVKLGDQVKKDDVLAVLDTSSLPQNLIQAKSDLISAKNALKDLYDQAETNRAKAEDTLAKAQTALEDAQQKRDWLDNHTRADQYTIEKAEADYYLALNQVDNAQEVFDNTAQLDVTSPERAMAQSNLAAAQSKAQQSKWMLDYYRGKPDANEIAEGQATLEVARAQLEDAQRNLEKLKDGPFQDDITVAQNRVAMAESADRQTRLSAPFDGTITDLNVKSGDLVSPNTYALRMDDVSTLFVDLEVSEVDINSLQAGQPVLLTFDAINNKNYNGKVNEVAKAGVSSAGVINFTVTVQITDADDLIKPGMTAGAVITTRQLDNVLMVPSRAVRTVSGQRAVYTLTAQNKLQPIIVQLGAVADTTVEIIAGELKEGDTVILNPPTQTSAGSGMPRPQN